MLSIGPTKLTIDWTAPDNYGPEITDHDVLYRQAAGESQDAGYDGIGTSMILGDLIPGTDYEVPGADNLWPETAYLD